MTRGTRVVLARWAAELVKPWAALVAQTTTGVVGDLVAPLRRVCAEANGLAALPQPPRAAGAGQVGGDTSGAEAACPAKVAAFAEQFCVDVSGITGDLRAGLATAVGADQVSNAVAATWVADVLPRVDHALARLFPDDADPTFDEVTWRTRDDLVSDVVTKVTPTVGRLRALDPVTTEVVRLRGAAAHNCRLCRSLRDTTALDAGADATVLEQLATDPRAEASLDERHRAAVALADAVIWSPAHVSDQVLADVRRHFSGAEQVEIVLDVARNGVNKIMVALGRDEARVAEGVELYHVGDDGIPVFS